MTFEKMMEKFIRYADAVHKNVQYRRRSDILITFQVVANAYVMGLKPMMCADIVIKLHDQKRKMKEIDQASPGE
jgi:hypothetical protein